MRRSYLATFAAAFVFVLMAVVSLASPVLAQDSLSRDAVLRDPEIPSLGNPNGDITIVEYFDYQCPYCKKVAPVLAKIVKQDGKIRLVKKDWPIFGDVSKYAAQMVLATKYQNKYQQAHEALIGARGALSEDAVRRILGEAGVDVAKAADDLKANQAAIDALLVRNNAQAEGLGFNGTPAYIIGTFRVPGVLEEAGFRAAVKDARAAVAKAKP
jgi:protein-disulfide isomerase